MAIKGLTGGIGRRGDVDTKPSRKMRGERVKAVSSPKASAWDRSPGRVTDSADTVMSTTSSSSSAVSWARSAASGCLRPVRSSLSYGSGFRLAPLGHGRGYGLRGQQRHGNATDSSRNEEYISSGDLGVQPYFPHRGTVWAGCSVMWGLSPQGEPVAGRCQREASKIERPAWHIEATNAAMAAAG